ncbi:MAG: TolC family protein [Candidatus Eisenbacteria bacterium]
MRARFTWLVIPVVASILVSVGAALGEETGGPLRLDLNKCVQMAIEANTSILKASYDLERSKNNVIGSVSGLLPSAGWSFSHNRSQPDTPQLIDGQLISTSTTRGYSSSLSVHEGLSGGSVMGLFQSLADKNATVQSVRAVRQGVSYTAKQKYLEVLKTRRLLSVSEGAVDLSKKRMERAQAMLEVGSGVKSDVLRAQVEESSNQLDLISARNALRLAETDLLHFLGIARDRPLELEDILETGETTYTLDAALADAMEMRPDIRGNMELVKAGRAGVWRQRSGWMPSVAYSWSRGFASTDFPAPFSDVWSESRWKWGLGVSVNLFDGLATFSSVRSAKAQLKSAREDLNQARRDAALEVKQAFYRVEEAQQRVKVSKETVSLAEEELRLAEERYRLGGGTMLEQIDAQLSLSRAKTSNIQALHDYLLSQAQLVMAVGKD